MSEFLSFPNRLNYKRFGACSVVLKGLVYVFGGFDGAEYLTSVEVIDPVRKSIVVLPSLMTTRRYFACCAAISDTRVVIFGGSDCCNRLNTCELFDAATQTFTALEGVTMASKRHGACAVTLRGKVYILGGHDGVQSLASAELFCPVTMTFTSLACTMIFKRNFACAAVIHDRIYIAGGHDGVSRLASCEAYDLASNAFIQLRANMTTRRSGACAVVANARMYILGGTDGTNVWSSCYVLDPYGTARNAFATLDASMLCKRSGACAVVVQGHILVVGGLEGPSQLNSCETFNVHQLPHVEGLSAQLVQLSNEVEDCVLEPMRAQRRWTREECAVLKTHLTSLVRKSKSSKTQIIRAAMVQLIACEANYGRVSHQAAQALNDLGSVTWKRIPTLGLLYFLRGLSVSRSLCGPVHRSLVTFQYNIALTLTKLNFLIQSLVYVRNAAAVARQLGDFATAATCDGCEAIVQGIAAKKIQRWFRDEDYGYARSQTTHSQTTHSQTSHSRLSNSDDATSMCSTLEWSEQDMDDWGDASPELGTSLPPEDGGEEGDAAAMPSAPPSILTPPMLAQPQSAVPPGSPLSPDALHTTSSSSSTDDDEDMSPVTQIIKNQLRLRLSKEK